LPDFCRGEWAGCSEIKLYEIYGGRGGLRRPGDSPIKGIMSQLNIFFEGLYN
jgi:hypothetical protein